MRRFKTTVVGAGNVGSTLAQRLVEKQLTDVVLIDRVTDRGEGKTLDLLQSAPILGFDTKIIGADDYGPTEGSDIVVITAGFPRKPGMSRDDLLKTNMEVVQEVTENIVRHSPEAIIIVVTNPLDAMCHVVKKVSGFPKNRVFGMAGILDTARFRTFIAMELNVSVDNIHAFVLGGHGDTMVPVPRYSTVAGIPIPELLSQDRIDALVERTRNGGAEIVALLKTGSAYYAPSAATVEMIEAIMVDKKKILPCSALCEGEYSIDGVFVGVPCKLGKDGIEEIVDVRLANPELAALHRSAELVREQIVTVDRFMAEAAAAKAPKKKEPSPAKG
ncbi:MAG: malate dehydrogenase [Nitrospirota bacterium]|nr:malate dehydrogenase [Nitrospirota bacterium]